MAERPPREIILGKAGELFHRQGYGSVSLEEIIAGSGLSKAQFYQNYTTKSSLGAAWLKRLARRMELVNKDFLEKTTDNDRLLRKYFLSMRSWVEANQFRSCQFANTAACYDSDSAAELFDLIDQYKRAQRDFFISIAERLVGDRDAQRIGTAVFLLYSGAMTECQNLKALWPLEDALVTAEQLCGVEARPLPAATGMTRPPFGST